MLNIIDHDSIREIQLNHPPVNALRAPLINALRHAVDNARDAGAKALMLSGIPGYFSVGLDIAHQMQQDQEAANLVFHEIFSVMRSIGNSRLPVVAAMEGHAVGGGAMMGILCDYRVMAEGEFKIGLPEVHVGLPIPPIMYRIVSRLVGPRLAERLCMEGRMVEPAEAERIGLVDEVVPQEKVKEVALSWCQRIVKLPSRAMHLTRAASRTEIATLLATFGWEELDELAAGWSGEETQAALRAALENMRKNPKT
uniref:Enoyl-CoA hydratase/carnithine racemase n=1 Tax=Candidatus Kentrum sp. TUN TaxID=2126343 RepID=A0A451A2U9_9GAMM|nr:MAG: Enoyl-CoA hydratase/carnithine racemase [Candidatus Kentron sp. TUN]VFK63389.1 MAG: Enoyl-CoA hydratase/carnithine racemase [Candidatus Kentron sp. TUN]VFK69741.1 MAG: Enoyl-CoA hydratase/carnithine racemase [Candidatus Kentron sp. TUN]